MHRHVHQTRERRAGKHLGHAGQRARIQRPLPNHPEGTQPLGDERAPIGQKRQAPGVGQPRRHDAYADALPIGGPVLDGRVRKRNGRDTLSRKGFRIALLCVEKVRRQDREQCGGDERGDETMHLCLLDSCLLTRSS